MANEQNLIGHGFHELTASQQREIAQKGGLASVEAKRKNKTRRELALAIANAQVTNETLRQMVKANTGLEDEYITGDAAVVNGVYTEALSGNMQAYDRWEQLTADLKSDNEKYELPARVIGKAFVDINRQIEPNIAYVFEGGRGGLKSSFVAFKIVELLKNNPMMHACITRQVAGTLKDSVYAQMKWAINELGLDEEFDFKVSACIAASLRLNSFSESATVC